MLYLESSPKRVVFSQNVPLFMMERRELRVSRVTRALQMQQAGTREAD